MRVIENPNKELVKEIREKIKKNNGHCACAIAFIPSNKCMCEEFKEQIKNGVIGSCHCGLYYIVGDEEDSNETVT